MSFFSLLQLLLFNKGGETGFWHLWLVLEVEDDQRAGLHGLLPIYHLKNCLIEQIFRLLTFFCFVLYVALALAELPNAKVYNLVAVLLAEFQGFPR